MKSFVLLIALCFACALASAQPEIEVQGKRFTQDGIALKPRELLDIMSSNSEALAEMEIAKKKSDAASIFGAVGGFMVGYPLGTAVGGGKPNWALLAGGAGLILVAIPFSAGYHRHAKAAVDIYNKGLRQPVARLNFKFGLSPTAMSLRITFPTFRR